MRNIPINGVNIPILEGGDITDLDPWMESYTNAMKRAINAQPSVSHHTVRGSVTITLPVQVFDKGDTWKVGVSGAKWPGFSVANPHTVWSLQGAGGYWFDMTCFPTRTECWWFGRANDRIDLQSPWNHVRIDYTAVNVNTGSGHIGHIGGTGRDMSLSAEVVVDEVSG